MHKIYLKVEDFKDELSYVLATNFQDNKNKFMVVTIKMKENSMIFEVVKNRKSVDKVSTLQEAIVLYNAGDDNVKTFNQNVTSSE